MSKVFNMVGGGGGKNISSIIITGLSSTDTVTCIKDGKTYTATWDATAQHWEIVGLPLGTFTITANNGTKTKTETVLIDITGVYEIEMFFELWLYRDGDECEDVTGGWEKSWESNGSGGTAQKNTDSLYFVGTNYSNYGSTGFATKNAISTSGYTKLFFELDQVGSGLSVIYDTSSYGAVSTSGNGVTFNEGLNQIIDASSLLSVLNNRHLCILSGYYTRKVTVRKIWLE